ncbi:MAG: hypothetical protein HQK64_06645 [Desulfamplus sp.]|nr:hypothetical protein [Desulfamplus sp.]MBF0389039.1 hypothetical protein [Desulfamplus sp.]
MPNNNIRAMVTDNKGRLWVGTEQNALAYLEVDKADSAPVWRLFNSQNSPITDDCTILSLLSDDVGGVWIGTYGSGLFHFGADGKWKEFNTQNSEIPDDYINTLLNDGNGGLWVGTMMGGVAHYGADGSWEIFNVGNGDLSDDDIRALAPEKGGGVWIGTNSGGLIRLDANGKSLIINKENSPLPSDKIGALLLDKQTGGLWIGTFGGGLAYLKIDAISSKDDIDDSSNWELFDYTTSELPDNYISGIIDDGMGGVWVSMNGESSGGVVNIYRDSQSKTIWQKIDRENLNLPDNRVQTIALDSNNGVWIGSHTSGVAHLYFGKKSEIVNSIEDEATKEEILQGTIAALIVAGGSSAPTNTHWETTEKITSRVVYRAFHDRGYHHSEIYCLSPVSRLDFNADGCGDKIVDAPVTLSQLGSGFQERPLNKDDLKKAFDWAKSKGRLTQPFFIYMIARAKNGIDGVEFELNSSAPTVSATDAQTLTAQELDILIDEYQSYTNNKVVVILESDYSGDFVAPLSKKDRVIITSSGFNNAGESQESYYKRSSTESFSEAFCMNIEGNTLAKAFDYTPSVMSEFYSGMGSQSPSPLLDDNGDGITDDLDGYGLSSIFGVNGVWGRKVSDEPDTPEPNNLDALTAIYSDQQIYNLWDTISIYVQNSQNQGSGNYDQYTAMVMPNSKVIFFTSTNQISNEMFVSWSASPLMDGSSVAVLNMPIFFDLPVGKYWVYNLLTPSGSDPVALLNNLPAQKWLLGSVSFEVR